MSDAKLEWDWQDNNQSPVSSFSPPGALKYAERTQGALISIFMNKRSTNAPINVKPQGGRATRGNLIQRAFPRVEGASLVWCISVFGCLLLYNFSFTVSINFSVILLFVFILVEFICNK